MPKDPNELYTGPFMPWFSSDWQGSRQVRRMSAAARGVYREALDLAWEEGGIADDPHELAHLAGLRPGEVAEVWEQVRAMFTVDVDGRLVCPKLEAVRSKAKNRHLNRHKPGQNGGARSGAETGAATGARNGAPQTQTQTHTQNPERMDAGSSHSPARKADLQARERPAAQQPSSQAEPHRQPEQEPKAPLSSVHAAVCDALDPPRVASQVEPSAPPAASQAEPAAPSVEIPDGVEPKSYRADIQRIHEHTFQAKHLSRAPDWLRQAGIQRAYAYYLQVFLEEHPDALKVGEEVPMRERERRYLARAEGKSIYEPVVQDVLAWLDGVVARASRRKPGSPPGAYVRAALSRGPQPFADATQAGGAR